MKPRIGSVRRALAACLAARLRRAYGRQHRSAPRRSRSPSSDGARAQRTAAAPRSATSPPPSGVTKESPFPAVARAKLANGMGVDVVTSHALPIVQVRVLVRAGSGYGAAPGVATLTGDMLKDGGTRASEILIRPEHA